MHAHIGREGSAWPTTGLTFTTAQRPGRRRQHGVVGWGAGGWACVLSLAIVCPTSAMAAGAMELVTQVPDLGITTGGLASIDRALSADGRYAGFGAAPNGWTELYVKDRLTGAVDRVTVALGGGTPNEHSGELSLSADGRYVAFRSYASNLVPNDTNGQPDVFVRDRVTGGVSRVSVDSNGQESNGESFQPSISGDGRFVAFMSEASNLVPDDSNGVYDVFVFDRTTQATERISVATDGTEGNMASDHPSMSRDGRFVAFQSAATNLSVDHTDSYKILVRDRSTATTKPLGAHSSWGNSVFPKISDDGRYVAFQSYATDWVSNDTNGLWDVFVHDRQTGVTRRASVASSGAQANGPSSLAAISGDGRYVAYSSEATNLVAGDTNAVADVFVWDRVARRTDLVSAGLSGRPADGMSQWTSINRDGRYVVFESRAGNLTTGDDDSYFDVYLLDRNGPVVYSNLATPTGPQWFRNASFETVWDDVRLVGGGRLSGITLIANNSRPTPQPGCPIVVELRRFDVVRGSPTGPLLGSVTLDMTGQMFGLGNTTVRFDGLDKSWDVPLPDSARLAIGVHFEDPTTSMGLVTYDPPTVGSSSPAFWLGDDPTPLYCGGALKRIPCNFGIELRTASATTPATFTLKPGALDFGDQTVGTAATQQFWLRNTGSDQLFVREVGLRGANRALFTVDNRCGSSVAAGTGCAIAVTFRPTSAGENSATLKVYIGDDTVRTRDLKGTGVP